MIICAILPRPAVAGAPSTTRDKHNHGRRLKEDHAYTTASPTASSALPRASTCARCASAPARRLNLTTAYNS